MQLEEWFPVLAVVGAVAVISASAWSLWYRHNRLYHQEPDVEANRRASDLLNELLSEDDRRQLARSGYLEVRSLNVDGRVYRVPARPGWVGVYQSGELFLRVCVEPVEPLPEADVVLMHKLMIEGDEHAYLRTANTLYVSPATDLADWQDLGCGFRHQCSAAGLCGVAGQSRSTGGAPAPGGR